MRRKKDGGQRILRRSDGRVIDGDYQSEVTISKGSWYLLHDNSLGHSTVGVKYFLEIRRMVKNSYTHTHTHTHTHIFT
jgi:hypothetical protein